MELNEKAICKALSHAAAHGGYDVHSHDGIFVLSGQDWHIECFERDLPRKVLALLVEHIGYIPEEECLSVLKTKEDFIVQNLMETALSEKLTARCKGEDGGAVTGTGVQMRGYSLLASANGCMSLVEPELLSLLPMSVYTPRQYGNSINLCVEDADCTVCLETIDISCFSAKAKAAIDALANIDWFRDEKRDEKAGKGEGAQIEMGAEDD